jgi:SAM-dependent methyltransferase
MRKIYVQYGSGAQYVPGWISFDASPTLRLQKVPLLGRLLKGHLNCVFDEEIRYGNIVNGLPLTDNSVDVVFCSHILEHLALEDFYTALSHTYRILKSGGIFRIIVPNLRLDIEDYLSAYNSPESGGEASISFFRNSCVGKVTRPKSLKSFIVEYLGNSAHLWMWDDKSLKLALSQAGFVEIKLFSQSADDLNDSVLVRPERPHQFERGLALECKKP